jgi:hypothetical protein
MAGVLDSLALCNASVQFLLTDLCKKKDKTWFTAEQLFWEREKKQIVFYCTVELNMDDRDVNN